MRLQLRPIPLLSSALLVFLLSNCRPEQPATVSAPSSEAETTVVTPSEDTALIDAAGLDFAERRVTQAYKRVAPSVVNITTQVLRRSFFYGIYPEAGAGSGFVLDEEGHILTNYHVVREAQQLEVSFGDDVSLSARVIGADPQNDIAVLKVEAPPELLIPVELGESATLQVGQRAIAIGNPFGQFERTLTTGVISALNRTLLGPEEVAISGMIQTDAAINRGNSGGPLLDSAGQVIGINTAIFSPTGASAGVGFAIPVDTIRRVLPDLLTLGRYRHPSLGIRYAYSITPGLAEALDLPVTQGLLLVQLWQGSPLRGEAREAQREVILGNQRLLLGGDILTAVDAQPIASLEDLRILLETEYRVGDEVEVTLVRDGQERTVRVTLVEEPR